MKEEPQLQMRAGLSLCVPIAPPHKSQVPLVFTSPSLDKFPVLPGSQHRNVLQFLLPWPPYLSGPLPFLCLLFGRCPTRTPEQCGSDICPLSLAGLHPHGSVELALIKVPNSLQAIKASSQRHPCSPPSSASHGPHTHGPSVSPSSATSEIGTV